jgi:hypothetical protein
MTTTTRLHDLLYDAQAELFNAIEHLETYVREANDTEADNYLLAQLKILASRQHGYLSSDLNIDDLLDRLDETDDDDAPDHDIVDEPGPAIRTSDGRILYWSDTLAGYAPLPTDHD